jgi:hypothetical protein
MGRRRSFATREKDSRALLLRQQGLSYRSIAREMGWNSASGARQAVQRSLADAVTEAVDEIRQIESARLDDMMKMLLRIAMTTHYQTTATGVVARHPDTGEPLIDSDPVTRAVMGLLRISERRAKLLGLDAPVKHTITLDQVDTEIRALEAELENAKLQESRKAIAPPPPRS